MQSILKFLSYFGVALFIGYAIGWLHFSNPIMVGLENAGKTIGWSVFWGTALILRVICELAVALADGILNFIQGQAPWLPDIPRIF